MSTQQIYNYLPVNDTLITAGQPTEDQLKSAADEGFATVINLATLNSSTALADEAGLVRSLGMTYHHIPVDWENPKDSDFVAFEQIMQQSSKGKTLLHCAANYRVTAFYGLFALKHLGWSESQADDFRATIWQQSDNPIWEAFIHRMKSQIMGKEGLL